LTDDGPVSHALSVHLSRAKLITRSTIDVLWRNFLSPEFGAKFQRGVHALLKVGLPEHSVVLVERSSHPKNQPDSFIRFDRTPIVTDTETRRHRAIYSTGASIASRGSKRGQCECRLRCLSLLTNEGGLRAVRRRTGPISYLDTERRWNPLDRALVSSGYKFACASIGQDVNSRSRR